MGQMVVMLILCLPQSWKGWLLKATLDELENDSQLGIL